MREGKAADRCISGVCLSEVEPTGNPVGEAPGGLGRGAPKVALGAASRALGFAESLAPGHRGQGEGEPRALGRREVPHFH